MQFQTFSVQQLPRLLAWNDQDFDEPVATRPSVAKGARLDTGVQSCGQDKGTRSDARAWVAQKLISPPQLGPLVRTAATSKQVEGSRHAIHRSPILGYNPDLESEKATEQSSANWIEHSFPSIIMRE